MENEDKRSPTFVSRAIVVVLIVGAFVTGTLVFSAQARAGDQQFILQDDDEDPKAPFFHHRGFSRFRGFNHFGPKSSIEYDALLAEALGITVEELQAAYAAASSAALDQAVAEGFLSEEQADMMKARSALKEYVNSDELLSAALGISVDELQAARDEGKKMSALIDELGLDGEELKQALQAAYEDVVEQAVRDGVITQDQANQILSGSLSFGGRHGFKFHEGGKFWYKHHPKPDTDIHPDSNTNL